MPVDLATLEGIMNEAAEENKAFAAQQKGFAAQAQTTAAKMVEDISALGEKSATITEAEGLAALKVQQKTVQAAEIVGGKDGVEIQNQLLTEMKADMAQVDNLQQEVSDILSTEYTGIGIIDNTINSFRVMGPAAQLNAKKREVNTNMQTVQGITNATETVGRQAVLSTQTLTESLVKDKAEVVKLGYSVEARQAELQAIASNATAYARAHDATAQNVNFQIQAYQFAEDAEKFKMYQEQHEMAKERWKLEKDAIKSEQEAKVYYATNVNNALALAKLPPLPVDAIWYNLTKGTPQNQARMESMAIVGSTTTSPLGGKLGDTPAGAYHMRNIIDVTGTAPKSEIDKIMDVTAQKVNEMIANPDNNLTADDFDAKFNAEMETQWKAWEEEIKQNDASNPMSAPSMINLGQNQQVTNTKLWQVIKDLGMTETNPQLILEHAIAAKEKGDLSVDDIVNGMQTMFAASAAMNDSHYGGFRRHGMKSQDSYRFRFTVPKTYTQEVTSQAVQTMKDVSPAIGGAAYLGAGLFGAGMPAALGAGAFFTALPNLLPGNMNPTSVVNIVDPVAMRAHVVTVLSARRSNPAGVQ